jgi:lipoprotein-anchoring transpeptidase ErfK/SrfK
MFKLSLLLSLALTAIAPAQSPAPAPAPPRPVLKALPAAPAETAPSNTPPPTSPLEGPLPPANGKPAGDDALRLQIFLDQSHFGPGIVDGRPGQFTELAVFSWNEVNGHPSDNWSAVMDAAKRAVPNPLATAIVPDFVDKWVNADLPTKHEAQAKQKLMAYRSVAEFMSERYHTSVDYLEKLNGAKKINNLQPRDSITVPNITPFHVEAVTGIGYKADPALSQRHVVVNTKINQVRIFEAAPAALIVQDPNGPATVTPVTRPNRGLVASFPITPGQPKFIHYGSWELKNMVELPTWRYDKSLLDTGKRSNESIDIPPGPNSPVGVIWCGTSKSGIGMHGTSDPDTIGRARSHGCIRLANWDAIRLPNFIRPGATVEIR